MRKCKDLSLATFKSNKSFIFFTFCTKSLRTRTSGDTLYFTKKNWKSVNNTFQHTPQSYYDSGNVNVGGVSCACGI